MYEILKNEDENPEKENDEVAEKEQTEERANHPEDEEATAFELDEKEKMEEALEEMEKTKRIQQEIADALQELGENPDDLEQALVKSDILAKNAEELYERAKGAEALIKLLGVTTLGGLSSGSIAVILSGPPVLLTLGLAYFIKENFKIMKNLLQKDFEFTKKYQETSHYAQDKLNEMRKLFEDRLQQ